MFRALLRPSSGVCDYAVELPHYTQENITINTHKRSQLLISTKTRYQLQQSDKARHTEHTTKHHKFTLTLTPPSLQNETTNVVIQQRSLKLLMMGIVMPEKC